MVTPNQQMINLLADMKAQLTLIANNQPKKKKSEPNRVRVRRRDSSLRDMDMLVAGTTKLNVQINNAEENLLAASAATKKLSASLTDTVRNAILPGRKAFKDSMDTWQKAVDKQVSNQASEYRDLTRRTQEYMRTNKDATIQIRESMNAYKNYTALLRKLADGQSQHALTADDIKNLQGFRDAIDKLKKATGDQVDVMKNNINMDAKQQKEFDDLTKAGKTLHATALNKLVPVLKQMGHNFEVVANTSEHYAETINKLAQDAAKRQEDGLRLMWEGLRRAIRDGGKQLIGDLRSQMLNAIPSSNYGAIISGNLGVGQNQLSNFIAENRLAVRQMGNGSLDISNGRVAALQEQIRKTTGLTGEDAQKYMGQLLHEFRNLGGPVEKTADQMKSLYTSMQLTEMSFQDFNDMVTDLSKSPAFVDLAHSNGYKDQAKEIEIFTRIMASTGYSREYLKEILDMQKQAKYQGIADMVKGQVGLALETNLLNRNGANISGGEQQLMRMQIGGADLNYLYNHGKLDNMDFNGRRLKDVFKNSDEFQTALTEIPMKYNDARRNAVNSFAQRGGGLGLGLFNTLDSTFSGLMGNQQRMFNNDAAITAAGTRQGLFGTENPTKQMVDQLFPATDKLITGVDKVHNAFNIFGDRFNDWVSRLSSLIDSLKNNPIGQAAGGLWQIGKGVAELLTARFLLGKIGAALPGGMGGGLLGGILGRGGGAAAGAGGVLARGGSALLSAGGAALPLLGRVGGGAIGGSLVGSLFGNGGGLGGGIGGLALGIGLPLLGRVIGGALGTFLGGPVGTAAGVLAGGALGGWAGHKLATWNSSPDEAADAHATAVAQAPVTSGGETQGDLLVKMVSILTEMKDTLNETYDLEKDNHDQMMDEQKKSDALDRLHGNRGVAFGEITRNSR